MCFSYKISESEAVLLKPVNVLLRTSLKILKIDVASLIAA